MFASNALPLALSLYGAKPPNRKACSARALSLHPHRTPSPINSTPPIPRCFWALFKIISGNSTLLHAFYTAPLPLGKSLYCSKVGDSFQLHIDEDEELSGHRGTEGTQNIHNRVVIFILHRSEVPSMQSYRGLRAMQVPNAIRSGRTWLKILSGSH